MKLIKGIVVASILFSLGKVHAQENESIQGWKGETYLLSSFYRLGSYSKERPTIFLEQNISYRFGKHFSLGGGLGINLYPALLAFPVYLNGTYHFNIKSISFSVNQSLGRNIKISDVFYRSNRYIGAINMNIPIKKMSLVPELGYNFLWDKYGGKNLSFFIGVGLEYPLKRKSSKNEDH